jgi:hypothetical protein
MAEMGHTGPALAVKVYAQAMRRDADEQAALAALVDPERAHEGTYAPVVPIERAKGRAA